jgi:hypothetical protein
MTQRSIRTPRRSRDQQPAVRRRTRLGVSVAVGKQTFNWRWVSLGLVVAILTSLVVIFTNHAFYVTRAEIGGLRYVPAEEVFAQSGVAAYHVLWIDPPVVARRVKASPSLKSAQVIVQWPARVVILVEEREPAIVWEQGGTQYWVDADGYLMLKRTDLPELVQVVNEGEGIPFRCPGTACPEEGAVAIDPAVVVATQQLKALRSNIEMLYYDPTHGLSYPDGRGWRGYFGVGDDMEFRLVVYERLVDDLMDRGIQPRYIDVSNPDAPFYQAIR